MAVILASFYVINGYIKMSYMDLMLLDLVWLSLVMEMSFASMQDLSVNSSD